VGSATRRSNWLIGLLFHVRFHTIFLARDRAKPTGMTTKKQEPQQPPKKKKSDIEVRDLEPKEDSKAGSSKSQGEGKDQPRRTGEIDFMRGFD